MSSSPITKILAPVDLSSCSRASLEFACKLAAPFGARIQVLFVRSQAASTSGEDESTRAELHRFVASVPGTQLPGLSEHVEAGDAHEVIVRTAESGAFDAIVLGTHGRTGRARSLAGSVAESTVRMAACPVITVREK